MRMLAAQAAAVTAGYIIVVDVIGEAEPQYFVHGSRKGAAAYVVMLTGEETTVQTTLWVLGMNGDSATRLTINAGFLFDGALSA